MKIDEMHKLICGLKPNEKVLLTFLPGMPTDVLCAIEEMYLKYEIRCSLQTMSKIEGSMVVDTFVENEESRTFEVDTGHHFDLDIARKWCNTLLRHLEKVIKKTP